MGSCETDLGCKSGKCAPCGKLNQDCCGGDACNEGRCSKTANGKLCIQCGERGEACCMGNNGTYYCHASPDSAFCEYNASSGSSETICSRCGLRDEYCCVDAYSGGWHGACFDGSECSHPESVRDVPVYGRRSDGVCEGGSDDDGGGGSGSPECGGVQLREGNGVFDGRYHVEFGDREPYGTVQIAVANQEGACIQYTVKHGNEIIIQTGAVDWTAGAPSLGVWRVIVGGGGGSGGFKRWEADLNKGSSDDTWLTVDVYRCGVGKEWATIDFNKACDFSMISP